MAIGIQRRAVLPCYRAGRGDESDQREIWQRPGPQGIQPCVRSICAVRNPGDRKSVVSGKSVSVRVDLGGRRLIKKKKNEKYKVQTRDIDTTIRKNNERKNI